MDHMSPGRPLSAGERRVRRLVPLARHGTTIGFALYAAQALAGWLGRDADEPGGALLPAIGAVGILFIGIGLLTQIEPSLVIHRQGLRLGWRQRVRSGQHRLRIDAKGVTLTGHGGEVTSYPWADHELAADRVAGRSSRWRIVAWPGLGAQQHGGSLWFEVPGASPLRIAGTAYVAGPWLAIPALTDFLATTPEARTGFKTFGRLDHLVQEVKQATGRHGPDSWLARRDKTGVPGIDGVPWPFDDLLRDRRRPVSLLDRRKASTTPPDAPSTQR